MKLFNKIKNGFWKILKKPHDTSPLHPGYEAKNKDIPSPPPGYRQMKAEDIPYVKQQFDGMFVNSLSPEFQKLYDKIKEKANYDPYIHAAFCQSKLNKWNDFETIVFIADFFITTYSKLQREFMNYVQNNAHPTITVNPRYKKPKEINK